MIQHFDDTFPNPADNLTCDEFLLDKCENGQPEGVLRFWEPQQYFVVLGYSNKLNDEIISDQCHNLNIPVFRRISGGGTVLQGPGCLNYSLILHIADFKELKSITSTNRWIMNTHKNALQTLIGKEIQVQGHTDLTLNNLKFSGNSQKRKKYCLLFHGTFLLDFDIPMINNVLQLPSTQPDYRKNRPHSDFLTNIHIPAGQIKQSLQNVWQAHTPLTLETSNFMSTHANLILTDQSALGAIVDEHRRNTEETTKKDWK